MIACNRLHHHKGVRHIGVKFKEREQGLKQIGYTQSVGSYNSFVQALTGEMDIGQNQLITVTHPGHHLKELRRDKRGNTFEHLSCV
jgi:YD repeat-containing protein